MEPAVKVRDLVVRRGGRRVLDGVSLDIPPGQVTGLLGPSGSGKTTLLRSVVGVQVIASGSVTVLGRPAGDPALRRRLGYQTQAPSIYPDLTVAQNIGYFAALYGASQEQADRTLADVGLKAQADQLAGTLSGGQQSRASLGCALVGRPELVVLDEPTTGQDPLLRDELWAMFRRLAGEPAEHRPQLVAQQGVLPGGGFVEDHQLRAADECTAEGCPALLPARQRAGELVGLCLQSDVGQGAVRLLRREIGRASCRDGDARGAGGAGDGGQAGTV